jgi:hypothetical protein
MGTPDRAAVLDDGTGVYLWDGRDTAQLRQDWVFMGLFRCEDCGRSVTVVRFTREERDRLFHRKKQCPGGCAQVRPFAP